MARRDPRDTSRDRRRRTVTAPNGARLILPVGTSDTKVLDKVMQFAYGPFIADLVAITAFSPFLETPPDDPRHTR